jgi:hypothetical protein
MTALRACRRGTYKKFLASEHVDDILFDVMDDIVPVHFARWRKLRTLGQNEKHNGMSEKVSSRKIFCKRTGTRRGRRRKDVLMQEPGVAEFHNPAIVKNKTQSIMPSSELHFESWKFKKITDLSKCDSVFPLT